MRNVHDSVTIKKLMAFCDSEGCYVQSLLWYCSVPGNCPVGLGHINIDRSILHGSKGQIQGGDVHLKCFEKCRKWHSNLVPAFTVITGINREVEFMIALPCSSASIALIYNNV